jgi:YlmC/YmxH family sporulation protein
MYDLRQKEVINIRDGCRFGFICDLVIDTDEGCVEKLIVPGPGKIFGFFGVEQEYHIPWDKVKQIGEDIILVDVETSKIAVNC